jgi:hypothetical protein
MASSLLASLTARDAHAARPAAAARRRPVRCLAEPRQTSSAAPARRDVLRALFAAVPLAAVAVSGRARAAEGLLPAAKLEDELKEGAAPRRAGAVRRAAGGSGRRSRRRVWGVYAAACLLRLRAPGVEH